jgi:hypothetical protein
MTEAAGHMKKFITMLSQYNRRKWPKLLSTFDPIYLLLYIRSSWVGEETSVSQGSGTKLGSTTSDTADSIML